MTMDRRLLSLATAVPSHVLPQTAVLDRFRRRYGPRFFDFSPIEGFFRHAGIETRYSVRPFEWFEEGEAGWPDRNGAYLEGATALFREVATQALRKAGVAAREVGTIVTVSSSGIATPSLEARVLFDLGFRREVKRVPVFGLGCAGGVTGLALAGRLAAADGAPVLLVVIELCTLLFRSDTLTAADLVATALFGDGAAAAVVAADGRAGVKLGASFEHTWPDTLDVMGWRMDPVGFGVILSRNVPDFVASELGPAKRAFELQSGLRGGVRYVCHPGGGKVVASLEAGLGLDEGALDVERDVLRAFGNMSAPTVLFALERILAQRGTEAALVLLALGPGFTASFLALGGAA